MSDDTERAIGYVRVSTKGQAIDGGSLPAQKRAIQRYTQDHRMELLRIEEDGASGRLLKRKGLTRLRDVVKRREVDTVLVWSIDRLSRISYDAGRLLLEMQENAVRLVSMKDKFGGHRGFDSSEPEDLRVLEVLATFAEWQRDRISGSTKADLAEKKRMRQIFNHVPYGYEEGPGRTLVPVPEELKVLRRIQQLSADGWSLRKIAKELNRAGAESKKGGSWSHGTVHAQLEKLEGDPELYVADIEALLGPA